MCDSFTLARMSPCSVRIHRDICKILRHPPNDFHCRSKLDDTLLEIALNGAKGSMYENGTFVMELTVPKDYPFCAPKLQFMTPIYHPNVDIMGRICLDMLVGGWCPTDTLFDLLACVKFLIYHPNVDDPLMPDRAIQFKYDFGEFERKAKEWTNIFAHKKDFNPLKPPVDFSRKRHFEQEEMKYANTSRKRYSQ